MGTGKRRGGLDRTVIAGAFAADGKCLWVADAKGVLARYELSSGPPAAQVAARESWLPPLRKPPVFPEAAGTLTALTETAAVPSEVVPSNMIPLESKGLLVVRDKNGTPHVIDSATGKTAVEPPKDAKVYHMSASPDESAVFATGGGFLYRLDTTAKKCSLSCVHPRRFAAPNPQV